MTTGAGKATGDSTLLSLGDRFASDLRKRCAAIGLPRFYAPLPGLQAAVLAWLDAHGGTMDAETRSRWLRHAELLDNVVIEVPLAPGNMVGQLVAIDSPSEHLLRELGDLAAAGIAALDAADDTLSEGDGNLLAFNRGRSERTHEQQTGNALPQPVARPTDGSYTLSTLQARQRRRHRTIPVDPDPEP